MSLNFYSKNEGIEREESINNYKELFIDYIKNPPSLKESLLQLFESCDISNDKVVKYTEQIESDSRQEVNNRWKAISNKYPSLKFEEAVIITSYTIEAIDSNYSPYRVLNRNLVSENRKEGIKKISKYFFIILKSVRLLPRFYFNTEKNNLFRCIDTKVNIMIDPDDEKNIPYITGKHKTFWAFTSTSPKSKTSFKFLKNNHIIEEKIFKYGTVFNISGEIKGYDITVLNACNEDEVLLEPERKYYIENHYDVNDIIHITCKIKDTPIVLEELFKTSNNLDKNLLQEPKVYSIFGNGKTIRLTCKLSSKNIKDVYVSTGDTLGTLFYKLKLTDKKIKFVYNGVTYHIFTPLTFQEIGLTSNSRIYFTSQALAG